MEDAARERARQVLIAHRSSNDSGKRAAAMTILDDIDLFELFCKAVQLTKNKTKNSY
jgi:hypothetical protein